MDDVARPDAQLHLAGFVGFGPSYVWSRADPHVYYDFAAWRRLAQAAERGLFSTLFLGDSQRLREHLGRITDHSVTGRPDQLVLFAHLAAVTERIGLVATMNTTFNDPADLARRLRVEAFDALRSTLPAVPERVGALREQMTRLLVIHMCAEQERAAARTGCAVEWPVVGDAIVDAATAVVTAPAPPAT